MEKIKHSDLYLISGAWDSFGGSDFTCSWQNMDSMVRDNARLLDDLVSNTGTGAGAGAITGLRLFGGPGAITGSITGAIGGAAGTLGVALADEFPVNVELPSIPMSPNWVNP